jgi:hypothetical protein
VEREADEAMSCSHAARKALFTKALRRGWLRLDEIDAALPSGTLSEAERWLLLASLRAANVELRDGRGRPVAVPVAPAVVPHKVFKKGAA